MTAKHQKTLVLIFENPIRSDVNWADIIALLQHIGAEISEGKGTRAVLPSTELGRFFTVHTQARKPTRERLSQCAVFLSKQE
jgi:hypothetical protein